VRAYFPLRRFLLAVLLVGSTIGVTLADDDHELARRAFEAGEVLSLRTVLEHVERDYPGEVVEVELERDDRRWVYEIKLIRSGGGLLKLKLDASDGSVLSIKGRDVRTTGDAARAR
jgi:uncharacterized membrane protein YkoI